MSKHILDRTRSTRESAVAKAVTVLEKDRPRRATLALQQRDRLRDPKQRQAQFMRLAREDPAS